MRKRPTRKPAGEKARGNQEKVAVLFQGGASRGAFQVGAMKYLDEIGIKPDMLVGSSVGVINACLYATGGVEKMVEFWTSFRTNLLSPGLSVQNNIFLGNSLLSMRWWFHKIEKYLDFSKILHSPMDISFILTNLSRGCGEMRSNRTEHCEKDMRTISRIGYTIPGLYPPIKYRGDYWCDGGFVWNVPLEYALQKGATRIFMLLCIGRKLPRERDFTNIYRVLSRFYDIMWVHVGSGGIVHRDFTHEMYRHARISIIEPSTFMEGFSMMNLLSFHPIKAKKFIEQGYRDAKDQLKTEAKA